MACLQYLHLAPNSNTGSLQRFLFLHPAQEQLHLANLPEQLQVHLGTTNRFFIFPSHFIPPVAALG